MKVAVLGASGFLGQEILSRPALFPFETCFFARSEAPGCGRIDFSDAVAMAVALEGMDAVVHLASSSVPSAMERGGLGAIEASARTLELVLEASLIAGVTKIVYLSSGGTIYGRLEQPARESDPTRPENYYGISKALEESLLLRRHYLGEIQVSVLRVANAFGPRQIGFRQQGLIGAAIACSRSGVPLTLFGSGDQVRDFIHASDVVTAIAAALNTDDPYPVFNIGTGKGTPVHTLLDMVRSRFSAPLLINYAEERTVDLPYSVLDISKAREVLGWVPRVELEAGIEETLHEADELSRP
ncbi:MAG: NAD-dependent epimerase/dehydratase family protein [Actinomycetota bacterium]|nr:NAD-dependent epimerase/dehydratase family protein [Actinomycetota bacterium]